MERTLLTLPLLPLPGGVVVPQMVIQLALESAEARAAVAAAGGPGPGAGDGRLVLVPQLDGRYAAVGTIAKVEQAEEVRGVRVVVLRGLSRALVGAGSVGDSGALEVAVEPVEDRGDLGPQVQALADEYRVVLGEILALRGGPRGWPGGPPPGRVADMISGISDPGQLADTAVYSPDLDVEQKLTVLETLDVAERLRLVLGWSKDVLAELQTRDRIRSQVSEEMDRTQREYVLRQQLAAIRKELGEDGDSPADDYRRRAADADLPAGVRAAVDKEIDRLERMGEANPEHGWVRTWLDTVLDVPWGRRDEEELDLDDARAVLDADHQGMDEVKERIVEFLAVRRLRRERAARAPAASGRPDSDAVTGTDRRGGGAILALVGPPGVGKTSLGESVARALGRRFVRVALGGIRDEAEIRGHRRTYVGAQPGRVVRALREAGTMNPVVLLDEVDKVAADWRGDPTSALLEVLDPAQNHTFRDHYLEVELDLSDVLFLATANVSETIPGPLLDRLEVIRLDGYTDAEKAEIARHHLLPRQLRNAGLSEDEVTVSDAAIAAIIDGYTREAGVRGLERALGKVARKAATRVATGSHDVVAVDEGDLRDLLGRPTVHHELADRTGLPGVATGLAVTGHGGDVLLVEATAMDGEVGLELTGQLGDVMQESARIALSYVRGHATELGIDAEQARRRFHLHVPAGAIPKDGPSAGITMVTALTSLLTGLPVREGLGMTGEVTLSGRVLPIGGVKQKVLAAHRAGLREVILPARNGDDLEDVPATVRDDLTFHLCDDVRDVVAAALPVAVVAAAAG